MTKKMIYERICSLLTNYEYKEEYDPFDDIDWEDEMYHMLVTIQNRWEDTITAEEQ